MSVAETGTRIYSDDMTAKEQALGAIQRLPARASFADISYEIELLAAIREAEEDIRRGRAFTVEQVKKMIPKWASKSSSRKARRRI
jgi:predicted transcriptional regulator